MITTVSDPKCQLVTASNNASADTEKSLAVLSRGTSNDLVDNVSGLSSKAAVSVDNNNMVVHQSTVSIPPTSNMADTTCVATGSPLPAVPPTESIPPVLGLMSRLIPQIIQTMRMINGQLLATRRKVSQKGIN